MQILNFIFFKLNFLLFLAATKMLITTQQTEISNVRHFNLNGVVLNVSVNQVKSSFLFCKNAKLNPLFSTSVEHILSVPGRQKHPAGDQPSVRL